MARREWDPSHNQKFAEQKLVKRNFWFWNYGHVRSGSDARSSSVQFGGWSINSSPRPFSKLVGRFVPCSVCSSESVRSRLVQLVGRSRSRSRIRLNSKQFPLAIVRSGENRAESRKGRSYCTKTRLKCPFSGVEPTEWCMNNYSIHCEFILDFKVNRGGIFSIWVLSVKYNIFLQF